MIENEIDSIRKLYLSEIHIFDVDGTIIPLLNKKGERIMPKDFLLETNNLKYQEKISEIKERMNGIESYPAFLEYYKNLLKQEGKKTFFYVTGRKKCNFLAETLQQLSKLIKAREDCVIFFPDEVPYDDKLLNYFNFKIQNNMRIITSDNKRSKIFVYDDMTDYYVQLRNLLNKKHFDKIVLYEVLSPNFWCELNNTLFDFSCEI